MWSNLLMNEEDTCKISACVDDVICKLSKYDWFEYDTFVLCSIKT